MKAEQKVLIQFERYNSKYNRLWDNAINLGIFVFATLAAYIIAIGSVEKKIEPILTIQNVNYLLLLMGIIIAAAMATLMNHLRMTKRKLDRIFKKNDINF